MALTSGNIEAVSAGSAGTSGSSAKLPQTGNLLVSLTSLAPEALEVALTNLALAFPAEVNGRGVFVTTPDAGHPALSGASFGNLRLLPYTPLSPSTNALFLTAADYLTAFKMAQENEAVGCIVLGPESSTLSPEAIRGIADQVLNSSTDLVVPRYRLSANQGLVNSAILYPVTRALYGARPRFPLAMDFGLSLRMAERLATLAQSLTASGQEEGILWPVAEAAASNWSIAEVSGGARTLPQPASMDLNALLAQVAGSLFADVNAKATFWQRVRTRQPIRDIPESAAPAEGWPDISPMLETFRLAYSNLSEIWSLVLPPNTLVGLKHLSVMPAGSFRMNDALWARIVYDFVLAYRLRTMNRGHLMGALTPLYLAWVASHIRLAQEGTSPEQHIEELAATFENDKAYLVSRWRWPDRFNP